MITKGWHESVFEFFYSTGADPTLVRQLVVNCTLFVLVLIGAALLYFFTKRVIYRMVAKIVKATPNDWDDELLNSRLFVWISLTVPFGFIWKSSKRVFDQDAFATTGSNLEKKLLDHSYSLIESIGAVLSIICQVAVIMLVVLSMMSVLNIIERIYNRYEVSKKLPLKSFIQVIKTVLFVIGVIFIISSVIDKSPILIFSGLGAATAILMLIFKDSILGLVAGVQLSANQMVSVGDWIEMPKFGADGEIVEVALTTVKVSNWDKTITTVPTYALISDSFKNWRGMSESGVRRIKRALHFDMQSVRILTDEEIEKMRSITLLKDYIDGKETEINEWNSARNTEAVSSVNARAMTNIGTFRAYVVAYLQNHPKIAQDQTILVRHLSPEDSGIPIEIYAFTNDNAWVNFEAIQSDIFDHLMAVTSEFGLRLFQRPSGLDLQNKAFAE